MKIYDKEIYNKQKNMNTITIIIISFIIGFIVGYFGNAATKQQHNNTVENVNNSIVNENVVDNSTVEENNTVNL